MDGEELLKKYANGERDFTGIVLCEVNLNRANLPQANFSRAILSLTNLSGANMSEVDLSQAKLNVARLSSTNLAGAKLNGAILNVANMIRADLSNAELIDATLIRTELIRADMSYANLKGANLTEADLREATLQQALLELADLSGARLRGSNLKFANLENANLQRTDLSRADLRGASLTHAELRQANLSQANLSGADLRGANLRWADLSGANLTGADLDEARLSGANLYGANLNHANLLNGILVHADLTQANLIQADWAGTDLTGASLTGAKLYGVSRFGLKAKDITCDWVDISPNGDRSKVLSFTPEESLQFFNATPPSVQIIVDRPLAFDSFMTLASTYGQIAREYPLVSLPPNIEVNHRRTILSFMMETDWELFTTAYVVIIPFKDANLIQKNLVKTIGRIQNKKNNTLDIRTANKVTKIGVSLKKIIDGFQEIKNNKEDHFFQGNTKIQMVNSSGQKLTIYQHQDFGRRLVNLENNSGSSKLLSPPNQLVALTPLNEGVDFIRNFQESYQ